MTTSERRTGMTVEEIHAFMGREFDNLDMVVEAADERRSRMRLRVSNRHLRPGGTVSGPTMMALADAGVYVAIFATLGEVPLAVTTNFSINFLRRPGAGLDLIAETRLIKIGRVLVVGEVSLFSDGEADPVAHSVATYSLPPGTTR